MAARRATLALDTEKRPGGYRGAPSESGPGLVLDEAYHLLASGFDSRPVHFHLSLLRAWLHLCRSWRGLGGSALTSAYSWRQETRGSTMPSGLVAADELCKASSSAPTQEHVL